MTKAALGYDWGRWMVCGVMEKGQSLTKRGTVAIRRRTTNATDWGNI